LDYCYFFLPAARLAGFLAAVVLALGDRLAVALAAFFGLAVAAFFLGDCLAVAFVVDRLAVVFAAAFFVAVRFLGDCLAVALVVDFLAVDFAAAFLVAVRFLGERVAGFLAAVFFEAGFLAAAFFVAAFLVAIFVAPDDRVSSSVIRHSLAPGKEQLCKSRKADCHFTSIRYYEGESTGHNGLICASYRCRPPALLHLSSRIEHTYQDSVKMNCYLAWH
jgi:hypothetical protein